MTCGTGSEIINIHSEKKLFYGAMSNGVPNQHIQIAGTTHFTVATKY